MKVILEANGTNHQDEYVKGSDKRIEPFFKYFYISKNILFISLLIFIPTLIVCLFKKVFDFQDFSISNAILILCIFFILFTLEKISIFLDESIKLFFDKETNFIFKLHNYQFVDSFKMKLKKLKHAN